jgi:DNA mismatch endonuclease, patch repair protein
MMSTSKRTNRPPTPKASSAEARNRMRATPRRDTACELALRSAVHRMGLRFRVDWPVPGTRRRADLAFVSAKVAIFVDGCFWHACPAHATWPKANAKWWHDKIETNRRRDRDTDYTLKASGWKVVRFWEHEDKVQAARTIARIVQTRIPRS